MAARALALRASRAASAQRRRHAPSTHPALPRTHPRHSRHHRAAATATASAANADADVDADAAPSAVVIGGGVSGLTCAVRLLELGFSVDLFARERPEDTVSVGAGAIWEYPPFKVAPQERARQWCVAGACGDASARGRVQKPNKMHTRIIVARVCAQGACVA
jgi:hypothetical protein